MLKEVDHIKVRALNWCLICKGHKDTGLVCYWPCYRKDGLRYGNEKMELAIDTLELELGRE